MLGAEPSLTTHMQGPRCCCHGVYVYVCLCVCVHCCCRPVRCLSAWCSTRNITAPSLTACGSEAQTAASRSHQQQQQSPMQQAAAAAAVPYLVCRGAHRAALALLLYDSETESGEQTSCSCKLQRADSSSVSERKFVIATIICSWVMCMMSCQLQPAGSVCHLLWVGQLKTVLHHAGLHLATSVSRSSHARSSACCLPATSATLAWWAAWWHLRCCPVAGASMAATTL